MQGRVCSGVFNWKEILLLKNDACHFSLACWKQVTCHSPLQEGKERHPCCVPAAAAAAKSLQSCPTLCDPRDSSPPGSPVPGILQCMKVKSESEVAQSCPTLRDPMDCSLQGSSFHGIFQARVLEWVAIAFSSCVPRRRQTRFFW